MWPLAPNWGHWSRPGDDMAKMTYKGRERIRALTKGRSIRRGETIDFNPIHALDYKGDKDFEIKFEAKDKEVLKANCNKWHIKRLENEYGGAGINDILNRMFPRKPRISKPRIPKTPKIKRTKPMPKPPVVKKAEKVKTPKVAKKPMKESEL